jgi:hypothetical protein
MPEMPAFLANAVVPYFSRPATVVGVEDLAPRLRRIEFEGDALRGVRFRAGQEVEQRDVPRRLRRHDARAPAGRRHRRHRSRPPLRSLARARGRPARRRPTPPRTRRRPRPMARPPPPRSRDHLLPQRHGPTVTTLRRCSSTATSAARPFARRSTGPTASPASESRYQGARRRPRTAVRAHLQNAAPPHAPACSAPK